MKVLRSGFVELLGCHVGNESVTFFRESGGFVPAKQFNRSEPGATVGELVQEAPWNIFRISTPSDVFTISFETEDLKPDRIAAADFYSFWVKNHLCCVGVGPVAGSPRS